MPWLAAAVGLVLATAAGPVRGDDFLHSSSRALRRVERDALEEVLDDLGDPDPETRHQAVRRLAAVGRTAIPGLRERVQDGSDPKRLSMALLALGAIGEPEGMAVVQDYLQHQASHEDTLRAALVALTRDPRTISEELARCLRDQARNASRYTVAQVAILAASSRGLSGLATTYSNEFRNEGQERVRGTWLLAFAEAGGPDAAALVQKELKSNRNRLGKRTALYAAARMGDATLAREVLGFRREDDVQDAYCLALGAFPTEQSVSRLEASLRHHRAEVPNAVFSLAAIGTAKALTILETALEGEWGEEVRAAACLAVAGHQEGQRFLPLLRAAVGSAQAPTREAACLALALVGDEEAAPLLMPRLARIKDPGERRAAALACVQGAEEEDLLRWQEVDDLDTLARQVLEVRRGRRDPRLLDEEVTRLLSERRAHWTLRRDDLREELLAEFLDLERIRFSDGSSGGAGGSGGADDGGGGDDGGSGGDDGTGGDDGGGDDDGTGGAGQGGSPWGIRRRSRADFARFEADLNLWLRDFPLFPVSRPWGAH